MPRAAKRLTDPDVVTDPLAIIEQYARDEDIVRRSDEFLEVVTRVVSGWGTAYEQRIARIVTESNAVRSTADQAQVADTLKEAVATQREAEAFFKPRKSLFDKVHDIVCGRENSLIKAKLLPWIGSARQHLLDFDRAEERRLREDAWAREEAARRDEQERLLREAESLQARGEPELANVVLEQAAHAPAPVIQPEPRERIAGISKPIANWKWRPIGGDTPEARARAEKLVPREFLEISDRKLTAHAKAFGNTVRVPGVEFYDAGTLRVRP